MKIITKKKELGNLKKECWSLDYSLILWLNTHLKMYLNEASTMVDLEYHKITYKKKKYTQKEVIKRLIQITDALSNEDLYFGYGDDCVELKDEMYDLLKLIHFSLWW